MPLKPGLGSSVCKSKKETKGHEHVQTKVAIHWIQDLVWVMTTFILQIDTNIILLIQLPLFHPVYLDLFSPWIGIRVMGIVKIIAAFM